MCDFQEANSNWKTMASYAVSGKMKKFQIWKNKLNIFLQYGLYIAQSLISSLRFHLHSYYQADHVENPKVQNTRMM